MKKQKKSINKKIDLTDKSEKAGALVFLIISSALEILGIVFSCMMQLWGFILAMIFPVFIFLSAKVLKASLERGVYINGEDISFEGEYRKVTCIKKKEIKSIYLNDPGKGKIEENAEKFKNVQIIFQTKDGKKYPYPLDVVRKSQLEALRNELL